MLLASGLFDVSDMHDMIEEVLKMQSYNHVNVMTLVGVCFGASDVPCIVMPFMANGSLLKYLQRDIDILVLSEDADPSVVCHYHISKT